MSGLLVPDKPSPSASLDAGQSGVHLTLEVFQAAICLIDGLGQRTTRGLTTTRALRGQILPKKSVIEVTTAVEVDQGLQGDLRRNVILGLSLLQLLDGLVVAVDIGLVVVLVVKLHDLARDRRLQSTIIVCYA